MFFTRRAPVSYDQAVEKAATMLLIALSDHAKQQFSSVQLEALRLRQDLGERRLAGGRTVRAVFRDIRVRAEAMLASELRATGVAHDVGDELHRILSRLVASMEQIFSD